MSWLHIKYEEIFIFFYLEVKSFNLSHTQNKIELTYSLNSVKNFQECVAAVGPHDTIRYSLIH